MRGTPVLPLFSSINLVVLSHLSLILAIYCLDLALLEVSLTAYTSFSVRSFSIYSSSTLIVLLSTCPDYPKLGLNVGEPRGMSSSKGIIFL